MESEWVWATRSTANTRFSIVCRADDADRARIWLFSFLIFTFYSTLMIHNHTIVLFRFVFPFTLFVLCFSPRQHVISVDYSLFCSWFFYQLPAYRYLSIIFFRFFFANLKILIHTFCKNELYTNIKKFEVIRLNYWCCDEFNNFCRIITKIMHSQYLLFYQSLLYHVKKKLRNQLYFEDSKSVHESFLILEARE